MSEQYIKYEPVATLVNLTAPRPAGHLSKSDSVHPVGAFPTYEHSTAFSRQKEQGSAETLIRFRLIRPEDKQLLMDFFHSHTEETIYSRYGMVIREMSHERALELVRLDDHEQLAIVGLDGPIGREHIVAIGRYALDPISNLAEVAFVVHEQYRGFGIATHLLRHLTKIIRTKGFAGITAQMLSSNRPMLQVLSEVLGRADHTVSDYGETTLVYHFKEPHYNLQ